MRFDCFGRSDVVVVTGGCGFLGRHIVRLLYEESEATIRVLDLQARPAAMSAAEAAMFADAHRLQLFTGSLADAALVDAALRGALVVLHTAAVLHFFRWQIGRSRAVNVDLTAQLLAAARQHGCRCFVYTSSSCVVFDGQPITDSDNDNDDAYQETRLSYGGRSRSYRWCPYAQTKAEAERLVLAAGAGSQLRTAALRSPQLWGPHDSLTVRHIKQLARFRVGSDDVLTPVAFVENAAAAHLLAARALLLTPAAVSGRVFNIADAAPSSLNARTDRLLSCWRVPPPRLRLPLWLLVVVGLCCELIVDIAYRLLGWQLELPVTAFLALSGGVAQHYSIRAARRLLDYQPIATEQAWAITHQWIQSEIDHGRSPLS